MMEKVGFLFVVLVCLVVSFLFTRDVVDNELSLVDDRIDNPSMDKVKEAYIVLGMWLVSMIMLDFN